MVDKKNVQMGPSKYVKGLPYKAKDKNGKTITKRTPGGTISFGQTGPVNPKPNLARDGDNWYDPNKISGSGRSAGSYTPLTDKEVMDRLIPGNDIPLDPLNGEPGGVTSKWFPGSGSSGGSMGGGGDSKGKFNFGTAWNSPGVGTANSQNRQDERVSLYLPMSGTVVGTRGELEAKYGPKRNYKPINAAKPSNDTGGYDVPGFPGYVNNPPKPGLEGGVKDDDFDIGVIDYGPPPGSPVLDPIPDEPIAPDERKRRFEFTVQKDVPIQEQPTPTITGGVSNNTYNTNTTNNETIKKGPSQQNINNVINAYSGGDDVKAPLPTPSWSYQPIQLSEYNPPKITNIQSTPSNLNLQNPPISQTQQNQFQPIQYNNFPQTQPISGTLSQYNNQQQNTNQYPWANSNTGYAGASMTRMPSFGMTRIRY